MKRAIFIMWFMHKGYNRQVGINIIFKFMKQQHPGKYRMYVQHEVPTPRTCSRKYLYTYVQTGCVNF